MELYLRSDRMDVLSNIWITKYTVLVCGPWGMDMEIMSMEPLESKTSAQPASAVSVQLQDNISSCRSKDSLFEDRVKWM